MTSASPSGSAPGSGGIGDHQLGQRLGVLIARQAASNLPSSAIFSQLQDLLGADTALLGPLRDLLARPAFGQLSGLAPGSLQTGSRDALLLELALTYNPVIVGRLAAVIDGCLGLPPGPLPAAAPSSWTAAPAAPPQAPPPAAAATPAAPRGLSTVTALLIALVSLLSGAVLLGLGWLLFSNRLQPGTAVLPTAKAPVALPRPEPSAAPAPAAATTPKEQASASASSSAGAWGSSSDYKFGQLPGGDYPHSCAFSRTDPSGRTNVDKGQLEFWACRDVGGDAENGYRVVWADGKETTYTFGPDGDGRVVGTNGSTYPMRWRNDSHRGDPIIVISHQDGAISWIPGNIE